MTPQELIIKLADHYTEFPEKWKRGFPREGDCFCVVNGLAYFAPSHAITDVAFTLVGRHLNTRYVGTWNDRVAKDVDEVIAVLRKVATS